ncbi:MAG: FecR domain-containing protein [Alphaproteobacteria bacterium]
MVDTATVYDMTPDQATQPIGYVETIDGSVFAARIDGAEMALAVGSPLYQGDVLSTGDGAAIGVGFADGTTFSMAENGSISLDEMVYDPGTQQGSFGVSVSEGVFTFVSGAIAKTDPEAMTINTPVASIGIRGTQLGLDIADGENLTVVMMQEQGGFVGEAIIRNGAGVQVLNTAHMGTMVSGINAAPSAPYAVPVAQLLKTFGDALRVLPGIGDANEYGLDEASLEQLIEEATAKEETTREVLEEEALGEDAVLVEEAEMTAEDLEEFDTAAGQAEPEALVEDITVIGEDLTPDAIDPITLEVDYATEPVTTTPTSDSGGRVEAPTRVDEPVAAPVDEPEPVIEPPPPDEEQPEGLVLYGTGDADELVGGAGDDVLFGGKGEDTLEGGAGDDVLYGGTGEDTLEGGAGDDVLFGDKGDDQLIGGAGADTFVFGDNAGDDIVLDYQKGEALRFEGDGYTEQSISVTNNGDHAVITFGGQSVEVTVNNTDMGDMSYSVTTTPDDAIVVTFDDVV